MIRIKRAYELPARGDGRRILVERLWPRGMKKESLAVTATSELLPKLHLLAEGLASCSVNPSHVQSTRIFGEEAGRVLHQFLEFLQKAPSLSTINNALIHRQGNVHHWCNPYRAINDDRPLGDCTDLTTVGVVFAR